MRKILVSALRAVVVPADRVLRFPSHMEGISAYLSVCNHWHRRSAIWSVTEFRPRSPCGSILLKYFVRVVSQNISQKPSGFEHMILVTSVGLLSFFDNGNLSAH